MRSTRLVPLVAVLAAVLAAGCDSARPIEQRSAVTQCARCHGFPPPPGVLTSAASHPQSTACEVCHGATVVSGTELVPGGAHMNGQVDFAAHPMPYLAQHRAAALQGVTACAVCHGATYAGGIGPSCNTCHGSIGYADWQTNCTFCHGTRTPGWTTAQPARLVAPPEAVEDGVVDPSDPRVGAHQKHLTGGTIANAVACTECHPARSDLSHVDRSVQLVWGPRASNGIAPSFDPTALTCANYCHGATLPLADARAAQDPPLAAWTRGAALDCGSCHEASPTTGKHPAVVAQHDFDCSTCHGGTYTPVLADKSLHVNGTVDKGPIIGWDATNRTCTSICHETRAW